MIKIISFFIIFFVAITSSIYTTSMYFTSVYMKNIVLNNDMNAKIIKNKLINSIIYQDEYGTLLPRGTVNQEGTYNELPDSIEGISKEDYVYCPYSQNTDLLTGTSYEIKQTSNSYNVRTINNASTYNQDYVISSDNPPFTNLAFAIIKIDDFNQTIPSCENIHKKEDGYAVNNGTVSLVFFDELLLSDLQKDKYYEISSSSNTLYNVFNDFNIFQKNNLTIKIKANDTVSLPSINIVNKNSITNKNIIIGSTDNTKYANIVGSNSTLIFENVNIKLKNIVFLSGSEIILKNSYLYAENSVLPNIKAINSKIIAKDTFISNQYTSENFLINAFNSNISLSGIVDFIDVKSNSNIILNSSELITEPLTTLNISSSEDINVFYLSQSKISFINSEINFTNSTNSYSTFFVDLNSELNLTNSTVNVNDSSTSGIVIRGKFNSSNSILNAPNSSYGLISDEGSILNINNSNITSSTVGIHDQGSLFMAGTNNTIVSASCTEGTAFEQNTIEIKDKYYQELSGNTLIDTNNVRTYLEDRYNKLEFLCNN